ncbi:MAG: nucleotidyltransferase domain-containing protein [Firmicutes bacterium]|nr:nucleotidyltransferase domain-containing protein [Candidatus Fermentithermobacillaceae bacterium]
MPFRIGPDEERRARLELELQRMTALFPQMGVKKAILFGSLARGDVTESSDINLILIKDTTKKLSDRLEEALLTLDPRVSLDVLVYTPEEFEDLLETTPLLQDAVREGRVIYEA